MLALLYTKTPLHAHQDTTARTPRHHCTHTKTPLHAHQDTTARTPSTARTPDTIAHRIPLRTGYHYISLIISDSLENYEVEHNGHIIFSNWSLKVLVISCGHLRAHAIPLNRTRENSTRFLQVKVFRCIPPGLFRGNFNFRPPPLLHLDHIAYFLYY